MKISVEAWVALAALTVSLITLIRGERLQRAMRKSQLEHEARQANGSLLVDIWSRIGAKPSLLRFHGVTDEELKVVGIDSEELAYLVASFEAAGYYYEHIDKDDGPFPFNSLRYRMCESESTQRAWPLLKRFFVGSPHYLSRIEKTIKLFEQEKQKTSVAQGFNIANEIDSASSQQGNNKTEPQLAGFTQ